jgi:hypothetical protein
MRFHYMTKQALPPFLLISALQPLRYQPFPSQSHLSGNYNSWSKSVHANTSYDS